jgi:hypothetical protein
MLLFRARMTVSQFRLPKLMWFVTGRQPETVETLQHAPFSAAHGRSGVAAFHARVMGKLDIHVFLQDIKRRSVHAKELFLQCRKAGCRQSFSSVAKRGTHERQHDWAGASALVDVLMESGSRPRLRGNITGKLRMIINGMQEKPVHIQDVFERPPSPTERLTDAT